MVTDDRSLPAASTIAQDGVRRRRRRHRLAGPLVVGLLLSLAPPAVAVAPSAAGPPGARSVTTATAPSGAPQADVVRSVGSDPATWLAPAGTVRFDATRDAGPVVEVDPRQRAQTHLGVGAAITESSASLLRALPAAQRSATLRRLFGSGPTDLGLSVVRVPLGASDFSLDHGPTVGTYQDAPDPGSFSLARAADVLAVLREIRTIRPDLTVIASPWSPPAWAKTTGSLYGGGLRDDRSDAYGQMLLRVVDAYDAAGVPIDLLSLHNEPRHAPTDYPGARISAQQLARLASQLQAPLAARGVTLLGLDHNTEDAPHGIDVIGRAPGAFGALGYHCYAGGPELAGMTQLRLPEVDVHLTECSSGGWATDRNANLRWDVRELLLGFGAIGARSHTKWNLALDPSHGPSKGGCRDCTGVVTIDPARRTVTDNHDAYALAHLARTVRPGHAAAATRVPDGQALTAGAWVDPATGRTSLLVVSDADRSRTVTIRSEGRRAHLQVPARSVTTLTWTATGVAATPPRVATPRTTGLAGRIDVRWPFSAGAIRYRVERATSTRGPWTLVGETADTWLHDTSAPRDRPLHHRVTAIGAAGTASPSGASPAATAHGTRRVGVPVEAVTVTRQHLARTVACVDGCRWGLRLTSGAAASFDDVDTTGAATVLLRVRTTSPSRVTLAGPQGTLATVDLDTGGRWRDVTAGLAPRGVGRVELRAVHGDVEVVAFTLRR